LAQCRFSRPVGPLDAHTRSAERTRRPSENTSGWTQSNLPMTRTALSATTFDYAVELK
jgi:hypothetical protein